MFPVSCSKRGQVERLRAKPLENTKRWKERRWDGNFLKLPERPLWELGAATSARGLAKHLPSPMSRRAVGGEGERMQRLRQGAPDAHRGLAQAELHSCLALWMQGMRFPRLWPPPRHGTCGDLPGDLHWNHRLSLVKLTQSPQPETIKSPKCPEPPTSPPKP